MLKCQTKIMVPHAHLVAVQVGSISSPLLSLQRSEQKIGLINYLRMLLFMK